MFDRDLARSLVDQAAPFQRALVATACLNRASALAENDRADGEVDGFSRLIADATAFCRAHAIGGTAGADDLENRFRDILGPDDLPCEQPYGIAGWLVDVVSIADYVLRTWNEPEESAAHCFDVLLACYSLAGMMQDETGVPGALPLGALERDRQLADLRAVAAVPEPLAPDDLDALIAESATLREAYAARFDEILAEY